MLKTLSVALFTVVATAGVANAGWERTTTTVGPHGGVWTSQGKGACTRGVCASKQKVTAPNGRTWTRRGYTACARGGCKGQAFFTGPRGGAWTRTRAFRRY